MKQKHNTFKRIFHRICEELKATYDVAQVISWKAALVTFRAKIDIQIMNRNGFKEPENVKNRLLYKHQIMLNFLEKKFSSYWNNYQYLNTMPECDEKMRNKIWVCWWQGLDNAPEIVKTVHDYRIVCPAYTFRNGKGIICEDCKGKYFYKCFTHTCCKGSKAMSAVMAAEQYFRNWFFNPAKYIDGFLYVSKFAKEIQEKYMPEVRQTHNITLYNFTTSIATTSKQIPTNKYFLFFGRLSYEKGVKTLLKAFKELPECNLKIVGTGPKEKELKLFVSNNSMNNVEFLGYKRGLELIDLVKNAYFVIVPSEWYENNPMTIIEAYSVGTPVIGAKIGGIPEIIIDGKTGYQFTTGNSDNLQETIKKIFSLTPEAYQRLSAGTLEFAHENLSLENYYPRLIAFYSHFLKQE